MFEVAAPIAVVVMCLTTYLTRIGGLVVMSWFVITPRVKRTLEALTGSTLVAMVTPATVHGDGAILTALMVSAVVMVVTKNTLAAMISGVVSAALWRVML